MRFLTITISLLLISLPSSAGSVAGQTLVTPPPMVPITVDDKVIDQVSFESDLDTVNDLDKIIAEDDQNEPNETAEVIRHSVYCWIFANRARRSNVAYQPVATSMYVGGVDPCDPCACAPVAFHGPVADPSLTAAAPAPAYAPPAVAAPATPDPAYAPQPYVASPVAPQPSAVLGQNPVGTGDPRHYIGRGVIGQPKLYVAGQPVRNALRFVTP